MREMRTLLTLTMILATPAAAMSMPLASHRAVYDLVLNKATDRSGVTQIFGRLVHEFKGSACAGYSSKSRFVMRIDTADVSRLNDMRTSGFENAEGTRFDFESETYVDEVLETRVRGVAKLDESGTTVQLEAPERRKLSLQRSSFPTEHLLQVLDHAKASDRFFETTMFDAGDQADEVMTTTVLIGDKAPVEAGDPERAAMEELANDSFWPVDMAFFDIEPEGGGEELPTYGISFKLHENGVQRDLVLDYGDFSLSGRLVELDMLQAVECDR